MCVLTGWNAWTCSVFHSKNLIYLEILNLYKYYNRARLNIFLKSDWCGAKERAAAGSALSGSGLPTAAGRPGRQRGGHGSERPLRFHRPLFKLFLFFTHVILFRFLVEVKHGSSWLNFKNGKETWFSCSGYKFSLWNSLITFNRKTLW